MNKAELDKHRKEAYLTCPETCECWEAEKKLIEEQLKKLGVLTNNEVD